MSYKVNETYDYLINNSCRKMIKGELVGICFLLLCLITFIQGLLESDKNIIYIYGFHISLYYIFPILASFVGLWYLIFNFIKYYQKVVFSLNINKNKLMLNILGIRKIYVEHYTVSEEIYNIRYFDGFKKKFVKCVEVQSDNKVYLIPVNDGKLEELMNLIVRNR